MIRVLKNILYLILFFVSSVSCVNKTVSLHYRPGETKVGDLIPFYWNGMYHVFYLKNSNLSHIASQDLLTWKEFPDALLKGTEPLGPDYEGIWTGSVIEDKGTFYLFYTGKNINDPKGDQKVMRALSKDLISWTKDTTFIFYADGNIYWNKNINGAIDDKHTYHHQAFRDPHVVWNDKNKEWWMGFHGMLSDGSYPVVTLYTSKDLTHWTPQEPLITYPASVSGDCPDIFRTDDKWTINLADYHYMQIDNPGVTNPPVRPYDCGDLRVAKTMFDGKRRIIMGWIGDYENKRDLGSYEWGGIMSMPREIYADSNGSLFQKPIREAVNLFDNRILIKENVRANEYIGGLPQDYMLHATLEADNTSNVKLLFRQQENGDMHDTYHLSIDYTTGEIALGNRYRDHKRICEFTKSKPLDIRLFVDGTVAECFINDAYCFTMRVFDCKGTGISFISEDKNLKLKSLSISGK